jgi:hypothetical protein
VSGTTQEVKMNTTQTLTKGGNVATLTKGGKEGKELKSIREGPVSKKGVKRYNLALPEDLYGELQYLAENEHTTVLEIIRRFIKLGLIAVNVQNDPKSKLVIHEGKRQRELAFII